VACPSATRSPARLARRFAISAARGMVKGSRMKITEAIALEHATLLRVFDQVERVLPGLDSSGEVGRMATILEGLLGTHAELETNLAFVALDHALQHKRRLATLHQDHQEMDDRLRQVHQAASCSEAQRLLRAAMRASRAHFRDEERNLFPVLERALGPVALTVLGEAFKAGPKAKSKGTQAAALALQPGAAPVHQTGTTRPEPATRSPRRTNRSAG